MAKKRNFTDGLHQRKDGVWEREEKINGKRRSFSSKDPEEVWRKIEAANNEKDLGPLFITVAERYRDEYVMHKSSGTQKSYLPCIQRAITEFGTMRMREIKPRDITLFLKRQTEKAYKTVANQKTVINGVYDFWIADDEWRGDYEPCRLSKIPEGLQRKEREPPTPEQLKVVLNASEEPEALPALLYLYTGARRGEVLALQRKDVDFEKKEIHIYEAIEHVGNQPKIKGTKTKAGVRTVPLLAPLEKALLPYKKLDSEYYLIGCGNEPITLSVYERMWTNFCRSHGMAQSRKKQLTRMRNGIAHTVVIEEWKADITAHQFRHEYITMLFEADIPEDVAIALAGHADGNTIHKVYLHLRAKRMQDATQKLNEFVIAEHHINTE